MEPHDYKTLKISKRQGIVSVTINNPPLNLLDSIMLADLDHLSLSLMSDKEAKVVLFDSANPDFFIAHADLNMFSPDAPPPAPRPTESANEIFGRFQTLPQATIGIIEGRAIGGGAEFLMALDMNFAAKGKAILGLFEVAIGAIPGAGGTQRLPRLMGRARALEAILGCDEFNAEIAEKYGWVNQSFASNELRPYVDNLAKRIASFPIESIREAKRAVNASENPLEAGIEAEAEAQIRCFQERANKPSPMQRFMELGGQDPLFERHKMRDTLTLLCDKI